MGEFTISELERRLQRVQRDYQDFAYIVSHDLNAPLRGIQMIIHWLKVDYANQLNDEAAEMFSLLSAQVQRSQRMIDALLEFSRIGRMDAQWTSVNTFDIAVAVIGTLPDAHRVSWQVDPLLPVVTGDAKRIEQLFHCLLENSLQALTDTGTVQISCQREEHHWLFEITDNGVGIPTSLHEQVFQFFYTTDTDKEMGKLGCGLSYAKKIIETHGGDIWLKSELGYGTSLFFTLPTGETS